MQSNTTVHNNSNVYEGYNVPLCSNTFREVLIQLHVHFGGCGLWCCRFALRYAEIISMRVY